MDPDKVKTIIEAALMAADEPLSRDRLLRVFKRGEVPIEELRKELDEALATLTEECEGRGYELKRVASGYRYQVRQEFSEWVSRLWEEKPPRYTRALMETLALIVYKQPVTRGDVEQVRGVAVSQNIMRTLLERGWVRVVGTRDVPGKPAMYGTTKTFLDYFNLKSLSELPPLDEIREMFQEAPEEEEVPEQKALPSVDPEGDLAAELEAEQAAEDAQNADEASAESDETAETDKGKDDGFGEVRVEVEVADEQIADSVEPAQGEQQAEDATAVAEPVVEESDAGSDDVHLAEVVQLPRQNG